MMAMRRETSGRARRRRQGAALLLALGLSAALPDGAAAQGGAIRDEIRDDLAERVRAIRDAIQPRRGGVLGLMGYGMLPDGSANALQVSRGNLGVDGADPTLTLSQFGFGFEVAESFPLYLEIYASYTRYDPRPVLLGLAPTRNPLRWNNFTTTIGAGWDFYLNENWYVTPILNLAGGYAASDSSLFASFINYRRDIDIKALQDIHANVYGVGGALMLTLMDYRPDRDIDFQARFNIMRLETFGDTFRGVSATSLPSSLTFWGRYRWPTGMEALGRPMRWVLNGNFSYYTGQQRESLGFAWAAKFGGGIELDIGRTEIGALGLYPTRVSLTAQYLYGDNNITGASVGIGISF
jgi:hypothetical protein